MAIYVNTRNLGDITHTQCKLFIYTTVTTNTLIVGSKGKERGFIGSMPVALCSFSTFGDARCTSNSGTQQPKKETIAR